MFYIRFTVLALTTAQLEIWWLLNTEFSQYITVIETPVLNNSKLNHWQYNSNKPWSCLTCYNLGKGYSPGGRQAGGFTECRLLTSGWLFIVALLQHIFATWCTERFFVTSVRVLSLQKQCYGVHLEVGLVVMNIENLCVLPHWNTHTAANGGPPVSPALHQVKDWWVGGILFHTC